MIFEYENYVLRKPRMGDAEGFLNISQDQEVMRYYGTIGAFFANLEEARQQVEWCQRLFSENAGRWIITEKSQDAYIGDIGFSGFIPEHRRAEIGYRLCRPYWGKGIIKNFLRLLISWGFSELGYNRIEALVDTRNIPSKTVLLRNHFQHEGTLREYECEGGHFVDLEMYSLLSKDYERLTMKQSK